MKDYQTFSLLLEKRASEEDENETKKKLVAGLHAVQGISPWYNYNKNKLMLMHSAFIRLGKDFSPLNTTIRLSQIKLLTNPAAWDQQNEEIIKVSETTDSISNGLILSINGTELYLNLERYGYLNKAANGYFAKLFYSSDVRQIQNYLAAISADSEGDDPGVLKIITENGTWEEYNLERNKIDCG